MCAGEGVLVRVHWGGCAVRVYWGRCAGEGVLVRVCWGRGIGEGVLGRGAGVLLRLAGMWGGMVCRGKGAGEAGRGVVRGVWVWAGVCDGGGWPGLCQVWVVEWRGGGVATPTVSHHCAGQ